MPSKKGKDYISATLKALQERTMAYIHVGEFAKVTSIDDIDSGEVNVMPLAGDGDGKPELQSVFILEQAKYVPDNLGDDNKLSYRKLKVGDIVLVNYLDSDHDNFQGSEFEVSTDRMHSVNDAIVVGVVG